MKRGAGEEQRVKRAAKRLAQERAEARIEIEEQRRAAAEGSICSRENKGAGAGASNSRRFGLGASREGSETSDACRRKQQKRWSKASSEQRRVKRAGVQGAKSEAKSEASDEARSRREWQKGGAKQAQ